MILNFKVTTALFGNGRRFIVKTDRNGSIYEVSPRTYETSNKRVHDVLSVVRGQNPAFAQKSLTTFIERWENERY